MKRTYQDYTKDIVNAFEKIQIFSQHITRLDDFIADEKTVLAIVKLLENIGEAVKKIPDEIKEKYPDVPWKEMAGMRDILVHEYFGIDCEVVWKTIKEDLAAVLPRIRLIN